MTGPPIANPGHSGRPSIQTTELPLSFFLDKFKKKGFLSAVSLRNRRPPYLLRSKIRRPVVREPHRLFQAPPPDMDMIMTGWRDSLRAPVLSVPPLAHFLGPEPQHVRYSTLTDSTVPIIRIN
jgi:hypothetical protein